MPARIEVAVSPQTVPLNVEIRLESDNTDTTLSN